MHVKWTLLGLFVYVALALHGLAAIWYLAKRRRTGEMLFGAGCAVAIVGVIVRTIEVQHAPLQNMFEVCLFLAACVWPLSLFCRRFLGSDAPAADAVIAAVLLVPTGFVFSADPQKLPPALQSPLFIPHVASYMLAYVVMFMAAAQAAKTLFMSPAEVAHAEDIPKSIRGRMDHEQATYRLICFGFPLLTVGLVLGSVWGKMAWGDFWNWDPKELWSFISFLVYVLYLHVRHMFGPRRRVLNSVLAVLGAAAIIMTLLWVNLSRIFGGGLHSYAS